MTAQAFFDGLPAASVYGSGLQRLARLIRDSFPGRIAVSSSFGVESAVLLDMVAAIDPGVPVLFLNTGRLFPETLDYRDRLAAHLGLADLRTLTPDPALLAQRDPDRMLAFRCPDSCCAVRKVAPLADALAGFDAWITGRKRCHGDGREALPPIEESGGRVKVNPLAGWSPERLDRAMRLRGLPRHPLQGRGYTSVGCAPCTSRPQPGAGPRSGRWAGHHKTECGIHK